MKNKALIRRRLVTALIALLAIQGGLVAYAQRGVRDAGSKVRGDFTSFHRSASRNMSNSRTVSRDLRSYTRNTRQTNQAVTPAVAQSHADELGQSIKLTQKYLAEERKLAEGDKAILSALDQVDALVAREAAAHAKLAKECAAGNVDAAAVAECCENCEDALEKAIELHDEIMNKLEANK